MEGTVPLVSFLPKGIAQSSGEGWITTNSLYGWRVNEKEVDCKYEGPQCKEVGKSRGVR